MIQKHRRIETARLTKQLVCGDLRKLRLSNGLDVIFVQNRRLPLVAVNVCYHVGAANDPLGHGGLAHLCEHLMFEGSKHINGDSHFRRLLSAGATEVNATTHFDHTNYFETLPSRDLELALWLESDRMGFLLNGLTPAKVAIQRDVVHNERREGESTPYFIIEDKLFELLFPSGHPYRNRIIGSHKDIDASGFTTIADFFRHYYCPNNASLAITGDFDLRLAETAVKKYFQTLPEMPLSAVTFAEVPPIPQERQAVVTDEIELSCVYMGWIADPIYQAGNAETEVLSQIIGQGCSSRLHNVLVQNTQLAHGVHTQLLSLRLGSLFQIKAIAREGVRPEQLQVAIDTELAKFRDEGPTDLEVALAVKTIETRILTTFQRLGGFGGLADRLNCYNHYLGEPDYFSRDLERYHRATRVGLIRIVQERLSPSARAVVFGVPGKKVLCKNLGPRSEGQSHIDHAHVGQSESWRNYPPERRRCSSTVLPPLRTCKLSNGLVVYAVERHDIPIVSISLVARAGSEANDPNLSGVASFTAEMLREGTSSCSSLQIIEREQRIGSTLQIACSVDDISIGVSSLNSEIEPAIDLLADVCLNPRFDPEDIERIRVRRRSVILRSRKYLPLVGLDTFHEALYGGDHPYGAPLNGDVYSNEHITGEHLTRFWRGFYAPNQASLIVTGDIRATQAFSLAERHFGHWSGSASMTAIPPVKRLRAASLHVVNMCGAVQAYVAIGGPGIARSSKEYIPFRVLDNIFCGLFTSRINTHLRQNRGYTYSLDSILSFYNNGGICGVAGAIDPGAIGFAVKYILEEMQEISLNPPTVEEMALAQNAIGLSLAGAFETNQQIVRLISDIFTYRLDADDYQTMMARVSAVRAVDLRKLAERYYGHDSLLIVIVGDRFRVQSQLEALNPAFLSNLHYS